MSCNDIASVLDTHRTARLAPADRAKIDAHLTVCADCSAAWHAHSELLALQVEGYTLAELTAMTDLSSDVLKARLYRARVRLGKLLAADGKAPTLALVK